MTIQPGAMLYTQGFGSRPEGVEVPHIETRAPTSSDVNYPIGKRWINTASGSEYSLTSFTTMNGLTTANWGFLGSSAGDLNSLTTDDATVVLPTAGTIVLHGNATQGVSTTGSNGPGTTTVTVADWTTAQKGVGVLSTNAQAIAGVGTTQAVTPAALQAKIGTQTAHGVAMGDTGAASALSYSAAGTIGQAFISGGAAADGAYGVLGPAGGGTGLASITAHDLIVGNGTGTPNLLAPSATVGIPVVSAGAAADPVYGTAVVAGGGTGAVTLTGILTGNGTSAVTGNAVTQHGVLLGGAANAAASLGVAATGTILAGVTGADPAFTGSPSVTGSITAATTITATLGNITATNGNFVGSTAGTGVLFNANTATGAAPGPVVLNSRAGQVIFTGVSIAAAADLTLTITNSAITGATTQVIYAMYGATTGSATSIKSVTNSAGSSAIVVTNGTGATTTTADITLNFIVVN